MAWRGSYEAIFSHSAGLVCKNTGKGYVVCESFVSVAVCVSQESAKQAACASSHESGAAFFSFFSFFL